MSEPISNLFALYSTPTNTAVALRDVALEQFGKGNAMPCDIVDLGSGVGNLVIPWFEVATVRSVTCVEGTSDQGVLTQLRANLSTKADSFNKDLNIIIGNFFNMTPVDLGREFSENTLFLMNPSFSFSKNTLL
jgi:hypothetical protein